MERIDSARALSCRGLADGYFVIPYTIGNYLSKHMGEGPMPIRIMRPVKATEDERARPASIKLLSVNGSPHRGLLPPRARAPRLGSSAAWPANKEPGSRRPYQEIPALREQFWKEVTRRSELERRVQPVAREGRPGGRLLRARGTDVPRRAAARGELPALTSVPSSRRMRARRSATTTTTPTWQPGSTPATALPRCTRKSSSSRTWRCRSGVISDGG